LYKEPKYKLDTWNPWTAKSNEEPFIPDQAVREKGEGEGERKLGKEFNATPEGQNVSYDLNINNQKWEVKKLDFDKSFRLGVEVFPKFIKDFVTPLMVLFEKLEKLQNNLVSLKMQNEVSEILKSFDSKHGRTKTTIHDGLMRGELAQSNLEVLDGLIERLHLITDIDDREIELYSSFDGSKNAYSSIAAFRKINLEPELSQDQKIRYFGKDELYDQIYLISETQSTLELFKDKNICNKLTEVIRPVFDDKILVFVDAKKGYKPLSNVEAIICYRITSKAPRCKYLG
tara:strand:+ start:62 stop:922 length:861 start_codon:yes stop_codon:yes gene_type:complete